MQFNLQNYITYLEAEHNTSPYTVRNYLSDLRGFFQFLQENNVRSLDAVDHVVIRRYLTHLQEQGIVKASVSRKLSAIRSLYRYLMREGLVSSNPLTTVSSPKLRRKLPAFLSPEEMKQLLEAPDTTTPQGQRDRAILELLYSAGLRVSELVQLKVQQVDLDAREIRVWGKGAKERLTLMGKFAADALDLYLNDGRTKLLHHRKTDALFINRYGGTISQRTVQSLVDKHAKRVGIKMRVHPHMLRHTFATHLLDGGADLRVVQELLGHTNLSSTQIYTHVTQSQMRKVYLAAHPRGQDKTQGGDDEDHSHPRTKPEHAG